MTDMFDLHATHNPHRYYLPVTRPLCGGGPDTPFMFGGTGLASAIRAMELTCKRPVVWATAQYLSFARPPSVVDLDVHVPVTGHYTSQAQVLGHVDDQEIITVVGALGERPGTADVGWASAPNAPPPEDCPDRNFGWRGARTWETMPGRFEARTIRDPLPIDNPAPGGPINDGRTLIWTRAKEPFPVNSGMLAIIADFVPQGISSAMGQMAGGNSLDNTIRFASIVETEWVLCDIRINAVSRGVLHGAMYLYSQSGVLMATASQSLILRSGVRKLAEAAAQERNS